MSLVIGKNFQVTTAFVSQKTSTGDLHASIVVVA